MKVMCIDDSYVCIDGTEPIFGEIVNASQCNVYKECYDISEYLFNNKGEAQSFLKTRFIPLSDIDETELIKDRELLNQ